MNIHASRVYRAWRHCAEADLCLSDYRNLFSGLFCNSEKIINITPRSVYLRKIVILHAVFSTCGTRPTCETFPSALPLGLLRGLVVKHCASKPLSLRAWVRIPADPTIFQRYVCGLLISPAVSGGSLRVLRLPPPEEISSQLHLYHQPTPAP